MRNLLRKINENEFLARNSRFILGLSSLLLLGGLILSGINTCQQYQDRLEKEVAKPSVEYVIQDNYEY
jgi:hypothetical protein